MDPKLFASTFCVIFVAEIPDKTAFASMLLATRRHPAAVFVGAAAAFVIQSLVAVSFGTAFSFFPERYVKIAAGLFFLVLAAAMWFREDGEEKDLRFTEGQANAFARTAWIAFVVIFLAEWGDLTQLATAALAARNRAPATIFVSATLALWAVAALAVAAGHRARRALDPRRMKKIAAGAFALVGLALLCR